MSEYPIEYISISILIVVGLYLLYNKNRKSYSPKTSQTKLGIKVRNGYINLLNLIYQNCNKDDLERKIRQIYTKRTDDRYIGPYNDGFDADSFILDYFYEIINYTDSQNKIFIFTVDLTLNIEEFNNKLKELLPMIKEVEFPILSNMELKDMLLIYKDKLNKYKVQMTYLSDGSDTYYFVLHPLDKEKDVKKAIEDIGLQSNNSDLI